MQNQNGKTDDVKGRVKEAAAASSTTRSSSGKVARSSWPAR